MQHLPSSLVVLSWFLVLALVLASGSAELLTSRRDRPPHGAFDDAEYRYWKKIHNFIEFEDPGHTLFFIARYSTDLHAQLFATAGRYTEWDYPSYPVPAYKLKAEYSHSVLVSVRLSEELHPYKGQVFTARNARATFWDVHPGKLLGLAPTTVYISNGLLWDNRQTEWPVIAWEYIGSKRSKTAAREKTDMDQASDSFVLNWIMPQRFPGGDLSEKYCELG
ncbi:hypothetical protein P8C59_009179 [Phyllachora maydis]|uniref:Uncharacterized protein n=1 Tax=Phyllachora maydis TaxID=1825666 RepID=A0AAD9IDK0_9PEZI|nr:hypothetical protein P8C59_009179 [Phyllachora maydis]